MFNIEIKLKLTYNKGLWDNLIENKHNFVIYFTSFQIVDSYGILIVLIYFILNVLLTLNPYIFLQNYILTRHKFKNLLYN